MSELAGKGCEIIVPFDERQPLKDIERSIIKKYRKHLWSKFIKAIRDYNLVLTRSVVGTNQSET